MLGNVPIETRKPRQAKPGLAPGRGGSIDGKGQPPFVATPAQRAQVRKYVACGFTAESISVVMDIPIATLERHFPFELQNGKLMTDARLLGSIVDMAMEGDKTMLIFYAKARGGWRERGGDDQGGGNNSFTINISNASNGHIAPPDDGHQITITAFPEPEREP